MTQMVVGIDVSKQSLDVAVWTETRKGHKVFENNPAGFERLTNWLEQLMMGKAHVCLEATGQYGDGVAEYLYDEGYPVSVVNPARIKRYGQSKLHRNKTDKADAELIAEFCAKEKPALWHPLAAYVKHLRALVRHLDDLERMYQQENNRKGSGIQDGYVLANLQDHLAYLKQMIKNTRSAIQTHIRKTPELRQQQDLLISIPGIGKLTSARLLAEIGDIHDFEDAPQLAAFAGLNPKGVRSGSSVHKKTRISKEGRPFLRSILYMPAIVAKRFNPIIHTFCERLLQTGLSKMAVVVAAMRKLLHLAFGVLKHQTPFDPNHLSCSLAL